LNACARHNRRESGLTAAPVMAQAAAVLSKRG